MEEFRAKHRKDTARKKKKENCRDVKYFHRRREKCMLIKQKNLKTVVTNKSVNVPGEIGVELNLSEPTHAF